MPGVTPVVSDRPYKPTFESTGESEIAEQRFGTNSPTDASSSTPQHSSRLANDGDPSTYWSPQPGDADSWISVDAERILECRHLLLTFPQGAGYGLLAQIENADGTWSEIATEAVGTDTRRTRDIATLHLQGRRVRIKVQAPHGLPPALSEIVIVGVLKK